MNKIISMRRGTGISARLNNGTKKEYGPYPNLEVCLVDMVKRGYVDPKQYELSFVIEESQRRISFDQAEKIGDYYLINTGNPEEEPFLYLKETIVDIVDTVGYIVFENGDEEKSDRSYSLSRNIDLYNQIKRTASRLMYYTDKIDSCTMDEHGHFTMNLSKSTGKIHICSCGQLMDLNDERKNLGYRVLPFAKNMDKYLTFYIYTSYIVQERDANLNKLRSIRDLFMEYLVEDMSCFNKFANANPRYVQLEYNLNIYLKLIKGGDKEC